MMSCPTSQNGIVNHALLTNFLLIEKHISNVPRPLLEYSIFEYATSNAFLFPAVCREVLQSSDPLCRQSQRTVSSRIRQLNQDV